MDGINRNIFDKYSESPHTLQLMDTNLDHKVVLHEFNNFLVWQMNKGLGSKTSQQTHNNGNTGAK